MKLNQMTWKERQQHQDRLQLAAGLILAGLIVLLALVSPGCGTAYGADKSEWTAGDTALQTVFLVTLSVDRGQTAYASQHRDQYYEKQGMSLFMGSHPTVRQTNQYFAACAVLHTAIAYVLPKPYRTIWQSFWIGAEANSINTNLNAGISIRF